MYGVHWCVSGCYLLSGVCGVTYQIARLHPYIIKTAIEIHTTSQICRRLQTTADDCRRTKWVSSENGKDEARR
ncbi:hypothetical protein F4811DRAFT_484409 [Daldinia bambusicola]|nr:hypothetical protein F4811DRAFT_484409 [Daldinia bambusicola]